MNNILDSDELQYWKATVDEIKNENPQWNWNQLDFDDFISKVSYENIRKAVLAERVEMALIENYDITTDNIELFANSIKMFCFEKMETRSAVSLNDLKHQIELVKFDISKGEENPAHGWIEKVNFDELTDQESSYYEGKKATPMDIVKGLPVSRVLLEKDIRTSVNNYMVTVIKSSSGQGKTTLALKTQYGLQKEYTPYQLINCSDRGTLRHIVEYFHARIRLGEKPLILIDNLDAHLSEWNQLVQLMQSDVKYNYKILITSRENDWYNYAGDLSNIHSMNIIKPMLSKEEAAAIFNTLQQAGYIHPKIKDWKHAWNQIADKKLLIEYVYLLTHGEMIAERISSQMYEIGRNETGSIKFELLRQVCFADVCGIRLSTKKLLRSLAPRTVYDIGQILKSMQNFLRQVAGLIQRDENDVRLALYNLKQAKAGLPKMHKFFDGMELDEEMASKHTNLCRQESQKILEIYMCCQYFLQHDASPLFDKYQIRNWYRDVCTKEIEDVNVALDAMQQEYDAVFPDQAYEEAVFKHYPIILRSFDMTSEEVMQDFVLRTIAFAETSFDYMLVLQCDENGAILQHAIKFPKRFFKAIQEALVSGEEITDTSLLTPYPIDVTENMLECFSGDWKIKRQTDNPYVHYLGDIAEELWVYSKLRELLCTEEDREYCICELKKVAEKIAIMKKEIHLHLDEEVADQIDEMCNHVYEGNCFDNIRLNEFVQNLQYIVV